MRFPPFLFIMLIPLSLILSVLSFPTRPERMSLLTYTQTSKSIVCKCSGNLVPSSLLTVERCTASCVAIFLDEVAHCWTSVFPATSAGFGILCMPTNLSADKYIPYYLSRDCEKKKDLEYTYLRDQIDATRVKEELLPNYKVIIAFTYDNIKIDFWD